MVYLCRCFSIAGKVKGITVRWGFKALTFQPDVKQLKSNDLASWHVAPLAVIQCWQQLFLIMDLLEFKTKLDNRDFWGDNSKEMWDSAYKWQEQANEDDKIIKWSWDCGLKLDYDGDVCRISSRFYPPHKSSAEYGKYHGTISVMIGDATEYIHKHEIEANTLDELQKLSEDYVSKILDKMHNAIRAVF